MTDSRPVVAVLVAEDAGDPPALDAIRSAADLRIVRDQRALHAALADASALAVYDFRTTLLPGAIPHAPRLEWIHAASAGVDAVMVPAVAERDGLTVTNSRGVFDEAIAEYVLGSMLLFAKGLHTTLRLQRERRWEHRESEMLRGKRVTIVGPGSIGTTIARQLRAAGLRVFGVGRSERTDHPDFERIAPNDELHEQLGLADYVVLAVPLTEQTRGLMGAAELAACRPGARLINIARGPVVDEPALVEALRSGRLAGAALDVFASEPLPPEHPFWEMEHVLVSPHMAGDFVGWEAALGELFAENFARWQRGEALANVVHGDPRPRRGRTEE